MDFFLRSASASLLLLASLSVGCAASLCERKARFLEERCPGQLAATPDPLCEDKIEKCSKAQKAQMDGYISCLETAGVCSLEVMSACQKRYPGGVNLVCN